MRMMPVVVVACELKTSQPSGVSLMLKLVRACSENNWMAGGDGMGLGQISSASTTGRSVPPFAGSC